MDIASYIDHTLLKATATEDEVTKLCSDASVYGFAAVCVPPVYVRHARLQLQETSVKVATVIGFPLGYSTLRVKLEEIKTALADGADELDVMINLTAVKNGQWDVLDNEAERCASAVHAAHKVIKLIVESGELTESELISACALVRSNKIDFIKTSTGFAAPGATAATVRLMRQYLPDSIGVKASGGIRSFALAKELIEAGATRIGCSASLQILEESKSP